MQTEYVVIVDAFSTGKYLASRFIEHGYQCLHVQTFVELPQVFHGQFCAEDFVDHFILSDGIEKLKLELSKYPIKCVIAGTESGVSLADQLSEQLNVTTNHTKLSSARHNKYLMIEALKQANVNVVSHCRAQKVETIINWQKDLNQWPIVLKPEQSAAADHVIFCHNEKEINVAYTQIISSKTVFNSPNRYVLAQAFLAGTEYIVNTCSANGAHYIAEIWKCHKQHIPGHGFISLAEELEPLNSDIHKQISAYTRQVLNAIENKEPRPKGRGI